MIYRLRFMDPKQAQNLITPFLTPGRKIITEPATNSLIFIEETDNARSLVNLLKTIDINILQEVSMEIVPLNNIAPQDAVQGMESLMGKLGRFKESVLKNSLALMPLNNFGGVLVMAQNPELLKSARQWIQAMDVRGTGNQEEIYVYFLQNGLARDIAQIVSGVLGIGGAGGMGQQIVPSGRSATKSSFRFARRGERLQPLRRRHFRQQQSLRRHFRRQYAQHQRSGLHRVILVHRGDCRKLVRWRLFAGHGCRQRRINVVRRNVRAAKAWRHFHR